MSPESQTKMLDAPGRILLVEDEAVLRLLLAESIPDTGLTVIEAANADEARLFLQGGGHADLVLTDVQMPGSMDGIAFGQWVKRNRPEIGIIITSGTMAPAAREIGIFVPKPYSVLKTAEILREMVEAKQGDGR